jgi:hypothetical protein
VCYNFTMFDQRRIRQLTDEIIRREREVPPFVAIARELGIHPREIERALTSVLPCPYSACRSFDTGILSRLDARGERHHCNSCDSNFLVHKVSEDVVDYVGLYA